MPLTDDQRALVEKHIGLVRLHLSRHVHLPARPTRDRETEDLFQEGVLALMDAAMRHVPARHGPFAGFAVPRIRFAIAHALRERFSTLHIPAAAQRRVLRVPTDAPARGRSALPVAVSLGDQAAGLPAKTLRDAAPRTPTIRQRLGQKYDAALHAAAAEWKRRRHRAGSAALADRIVDERLTISEPAHRTPLRRIARDLGASSSHVTRCEQFLIRGVAGRLEGDGEYRILREAARRAPDGIDAPVDARLRTVVRGACRKASLKAFGRLDEAGKGAFLIRAIRLARMDPTPLVDVTLQRLSEDQMRSLPVATPRRSADRSTHESPRPMRRAHDPSGPARSDAVDDPAAGRRQAPRSHVRKTRVDTR